MKSFVLVTLISLLFGSSVTIPSSHEPATIAGPSPNAQYAGAWSESNNDQTGIEAGSASCLGHITGAMARLLSVSKTTARHIFAVARLSKPHSLDPSEVAGRAVSHKVETGQRSKRALDKPVGKFLVFLNITLPLADQNPPPTPVTPEISGGISISNTSTGQFSDATAGKLSTVGPKPSEPLAPLQLSVVVSNIL